MMVTRGNPFQMASNHAKLRKMFGNTFGNALSYGNAFHYGAGNLFKLW